MFERPSLPKRDRAPVPSIPYSEFAQLQDNEKRELVTETFTNFQELLTQNGYTEFTEITELYKNLPDAAYIVRRENPERIEQLLAAGQSYEIKHEGDTEYANSVEWNPNSMERSIENAYLEGYGNKNTIVVVVGIRPNPALELKHLPESTPDFYGLDRRGVRSVTGTVSPEHIAFVSIRAAAHMLPESILTEEELDALDQARESASKKPIFIHRGYLRATQ